jgi:formylglycine-generating enzyme required for sulfatase activity
MKARVFVLAACLLVLAQAGLPAAPGDFIYAHPGRLVSTPDGTRLNIYCLGNGSPAVVFDSGWGDWSPAWAVVQPQVARFTRACSYDRAGYGFSQAGPMPRTSVRVADELHAALHAAGISPPYILVAAAFGSYYLRVFADRYMSEVGGIVLSDADDGDVEPARWQKRDKDAIPRLVARMRSCRDAIASGLPVPGACPRNFFRGLPEQTFSPELNAALLHEVGTQTAPYDAAISEMQAMPDDWAYLQQHLRSFGSRPIRVLTTWHFGRPPETPASVHRERLAFEHDSARAQASWLSLSTNARQIFDYDEGKLYIQLDHPHVVVDAIREITAVVSRDCTECPEMVAVPAGSFTMGSSASEKAWAVSHGASPGAVADEAPPHTVSLQSFAIGRYPVTHAEFAAFVRESGYAPQDGCAPNSFRWKVQSGLNWRSPGFPQSNRDPVVCVSWNDAQAYVAWLNRKAGSHSTGTPYHLPSESQWEYAARAGSTTPFWWGTGEDDAAEHAWYFINAGGRTRPVGLKPANAFGLYDAVGNVWEWTADCYADSYAGAPADGRPKEPRKDCLRVDRGGSWLYPGWLLRSATRERNPAGFRDVIMGFRVAK